MPDTRLIPRVEQLREIADELQACESADEIFDHAVTASEAVIEFDAAIICTVEDGLLVPRAVNVQGLIPGELRSTADGIAGKTVRENRTVIVDDLASEPDAAPTTDRFRSTLSIPLDIGGVLQFHSTEPADFSSVERELGELLVANVTNALGRVTYESALSRERDQFAALFENIPDAALQYRVEDGVQIVEAVNSSFVSVFGYRGEDVVGEPIDELLVSHEDGVEPELVTAAEAERRTDIEVTRETASGPRPFLLRNVPMRTDDDSIRGYLIYTDLTALKMREQELVRKNERLDQFASIVSHDLRNPLNVANGYLELLRDRESHEELEEIADAHERMERLIEGVLALARDGGQIDDCEPVHVATVAREAWDNVATNGATLRTDADEVIDADANRLLQLFENLFRNAIEHAGTDTAVRVESDGEGFAVEDDGPGIPSEQRDVVFESGYSSATDNTGLGLAIVRQITEAHGWTVEVAESDAGGARFEFTCDSSNRPTPSQLVDGVAGGAR